MWPNVKKRLAIAVGVVISAACVAFFAFIIDWAEFVRAFRTINGWWFLGALAAATASYGCRAFQWRYVLGRVRRVPLRSLFTVTMIGFMANTLLPLRLGEVVRAYLLGTRENLPYGTVLGSIIVTRLFDGGIMALIFGGFALLFPTEMAGVKAGIVTITCVYFCLAAAFALFHFNMRAANALLGATLGRLSKRVAVRARRGLEKFNRGFSCFRDPGDLIKALAYSAGVWLLVGLSYYFVARGFDFSRSLPAYSLLLVMAVQNAAVVVPSSPGFIGTMELGIVAGLKIIAPHINRNVALSYAVVVHVVQLSPAVLGGLVLLWKERLTFGDLAAAPTDEDPTAPPESGDDL